MVQKIHPRGVIWVPSISPHAGHLSEKNDNLAVQYEDVHEVDYQRISQRLLYLIWTQFSEQKLQLCMLKSENF